MGAPLSFLDHHLRWGNSLIGADVRTVEAAIQRTASGQFGLFAGPFAGLLDLTGVMIQIAEQADSTLADVRRSAEDFAGFQASLTPYKQVLDLWVSQYFGNQAGLEFLTLFGGEVVPALKGQRPVSAPQQAAIERARDLWREKRFFHWDLEFPEVFIDLARRDWAENPGFDAVIGNPPYVRSLRLKDADPAVWAYYSRIYQAAAKREFDIYLCFVELAARLLNVNGHSGMILPNKWFTTQVGESLRSLLASRRIAEYIVDFGPFQVFESVTTYTCLLFLAGTPQEQLRVAALDAADGGLQPVPGKSGAWQEAMVAAQSLGSNPWTFVLGSANTLLAGLAELPRLEEIANVFKGTGTSADSVFMMERQGNRFYSRSLNAWMELEEEIMRPSLTGRDVDRYEYQPEHYLLFPYQSLGKDWRLLAPEDMGARYPKAWAYLNHPINREILEGRDRGKFKKRNDWYCHSYPRNMSFLGQPKLVLPDVAGQAEFGCDFEGRYIIDTVYGIRLREAIEITLPALAALLNSSLMTFFLRQTGTDLRGGYFRMKTAYLNPFPLPKIAFTTPAAERQALAAEGRRLYAEYRASGDASAVMAWVEGNLTSPPAPLLSGARRGEGSERARATAFADSGVSRGEGGAGAEHPLGDREKGSESKVLHTKVPGHVIELARKLRQQQTRAEELLWMCLRNRMLNGLKFRRQHPLGRYIADFYCAEKRLVIELDGAVHRHPDQQAYDQIQQQEIEARGLIVLRLRNQQVEYDLEHALDLIADVATRGLVALPPTLPPLSSPYVERRGGRG